MGCIVAASADDMDLSAHSDLKNPSEDERRATKSALLGKVDAFEDAGETVDDFIDGSPKSNT